MGANLDLCSEVKASQRPFKTHEASGERSLPLESLKPPEESKTMPSFVRRFQNTRSAFMSEFRALVSLPAGAGSVKEVRMSCNGEQRRK